MTYEEMILPAVIDRGTAAEKLAEIAVCAKACHGEEVDGHHFHSAAELFGYKVQKILHEMGLFGERKGGADEALFGGEDNRG